MAFAYFLVTGIYTDGRRFKAIKTYSFQHAMGINLYKGSVWGVDFRGKRQLLKREGW